MIIGMDAPLKFNSRKSILRGPLVSMISTHTFETVISPNLSNIKDIDVLIAGANYPIRNEIINYLKANGVLVNPNNTGLFYEKKSYNQYLILSCRTKIRIVTLSTFDGSDLHMKGQIAEALSTAALLFVDSSYLISNYFKEGEEFICFASMNDLLEKVRWYLNNDEERLNISMAGHKRWVENYSGFKSLKILFDMTTIQL